MQIRPADPARNPPQRVTVGLTVGSCLRVSVGPQHTGFVIQRIFLTVGGVEGLEGWAGRWEHPPERGVAGMQVRSGAQSQAAAAGGWPRGGGVSGLVPSCGLQSGRPARAPASALDACELAVGTRHGRLRSHKGTIYRDFFFNLL